MNDLMKTDIVSEMLGNSPTMRVISLLILGRGWDYSISDIEGGAGVGWATLHYVLPRLEKNNLITHTRMVGRAKMYALNLENPACEKLVELHNIILNQSIDKVIAKNEQTTSIKKRAAPIPA